METENESFLVYTYNAENVSRMTRTIVWLFQTNTGK